MSSFVFENPPLMQTEEGRILSEYLARQMLALSEAVQPSEGGEYMVWKGPWEDGQYFLNDVVTDEYWLAIANKDTTEKPAPQTQGDPANVIDIPGAPAFATNTVSATQLIVGTRYTNSSAVYVRKIRYQIPATMVGFTAEYYIVVEPEGANPTTRSIVSEFTIDVGDTGSWQEVSLGLELLPAGSTFDILGVFTPVTGATQFIYEWDYERKNGDPDPGKIWHQSGGDADQMRVHEQDKSDTDRSLDLDNIGPGSTIEMLSSGYKWSVFGASKAGDVYTFQVDPASRANAATSDFRFTYYSLLSMDYLIAANHYTTLPGVSGFQSTTGYDGNPTLNQNAYGIDINIQDVRLSKDWDFLAYSG